MPRILVIDDDPEFSAFLSDYLEQRKHEVLYRNLAEDSLELLDAAEKIQLILLDNRMPRLSGLEFLRQLKGRGVTVPVILMTSAHNDRTAIQAINVGAFDYVIKPLTFDDIECEFGPVIDAALKLTERQQRVPLPNEPDCDDSEMVGRSEAMVSVLKQIGRVLRVDEAVLILGESGTGKELVARAIHTNSPRADKPFVVINCGALNDNLLDDELFGHEPGAFTNASKLRKGRFEHAEGGTLFLDEVGDMPLALQVKLLRVLENREVFRLGNNDPIHVNVRVLAATHRDLKTLVAQDKFRQDLLHRLDGMPVALPPLRERKDDIELLARRFLTRMFGSNSSAPSLHPEALNALCNYSWPGNVRQLQKVLCRAAGTVQGTQIMPEDLNFGELAKDSAALEETLTRDSALAGLRKAIAWAWRSEQPDLWPLLQGQLECELLRFALDGLHGNQSDAARRLGMARNTLRARLKQYGLEETPAEGP